MIFERTNKPRLFGHRGCSQKAPENTLAAFSLAKTYGIAGVELDIHPCQTGEIIVLHDTTLDRTTNGSGSVYNLGINQIKEFDAGSWFGPTFSDQKIPLLLEVFELLGNSVIYDIEIKSGNYKVDEFLYNLNQLIFRYNLQNHCLISSFDPFILRKWKKSYTSLPTAQLYSTHKEVPFLFRGGKLPTLISKADMEKPHHEQIKQGGMKHPFLAWTVNDQAEFDRLKALKVWGVISDCPEDLII
ncbi:glycerophosphodiester phosphodiesterase [Spirochaeta cellobiosiphila]|uniref:glycerophosphodiester phosphodiesterase n=1 Tax=Spirochaeta cellobiosiphila TaxID=504483 RepID=UPI00041E4DC9|nr:glycerophosphodiester phosphodiesterase family protein [Spirochaeta cellobiosiphila]